MLACGVIEPQSSAPAQPVELSATATATASGEREPGVSLGVSDGAVLTDGSPTDARATPDTPEAGTRPPDLDAGPDAEQDVANPSAVASGITPPPTDVSGSTGSDEGGVGGVEQGENDRSWEALRKVARRCPKGPRCVSIRLHVVSDQAQLPVIGAGWLESQIREANRHFKSSDLAFRITSVDSVDASFTIVSTREQRDEIGRKRFARGRIDVYGVGQLDDVDAIGEQIRGVHWRDRVSTDRRWIIIAGYAGKGVLAHELGHFFGLPHSTYAASIMNKRDRAKPPPEMRSFVPEEREIIAEKAASYFVDGTLEPVGESK